MKLHGNKFFKSVSPNEFVEKGTLIWTETTNVRNKHVCEGPFFLLKDWNLEAFESKKSLSLLSIESGVVFFVNSYSFLFTTFYILDLDEK